MCKRTIWLSIFTSTFLASCATQGDVAKQLPITTSSPESSLLSQEAELSAFLPAGATLRLSARGDIDADGDDDALIVYTPESATENVPRTLLLLLRDVGGALRKSVENPDAILCRKCGGMMGDPLQQIRVGLGEFTLRFEGGSRELWSSEFRFIYARDRGIWKLAEIIFNDFDRADGKAAEHRKGTADFGDVSLKEFDAAYLSVDASP